jgi:hypothetical protein
MLRQFEAERASSIAIVMSAARRPDYGDMTLTFAIALGEVLKSQRHWLNGFHDLTLLRSVHPCPACAAPLRFPKTCHGSGIAPFP